MSRCKNRSQVRSFLEDVSVWTNGCWQWIGHTNKYNGYGCTWYDQKRILAHRFMWELINDTKVPLGKVVMHTCDNPLCVNPEHLRLGTQQENIADMISKDRQCSLSGEDHPRNKVTSDLIVEARRLRRNGHNRQEIAKALSLGPSTVGHMLSPNSRYLARPQRIRNADPSLYLLEQEQFDANTTD